MIRTKLYMILAALLVCSMVCIYNTSRLTNIWSRRYLSENNCKPVKECPEGEEAYFKAHPDVAKLWKPTRGSAYSHWVTYGKHEGRKYSCKCPESRNKDDSEPVEQKGDGMVESKTNDITIFYNVYIPNDSAHNTERVMSIINEQLEYRKNSMFANIPLHYVTIGKDIGELENCNNCEKIRHLDIGDEIDTLSYLYEHCTINPKAIVAYIHNKGSEHLYGINEKFRRMLTKAVFSPDCLFLKTPPGDESGCKCNICSARFSPIPYLYMSGNMWVSHCSYVSKLMHPSKITSTMTEMVRSVPTEKFGEVISYGAAALGLDRCAREHWITTHPDSCPCDVYPGTTYQHAYRNLPPDDNWTPTLSRAPRESVFGRQAIKGGGPGRENWFYTEGRIYEYQFLYNKIPDGNSWFWKFYPSAEGPISES